MTVRMRASEKDSTTSNNCIFECRASSRGPQLLVSVRSLTEAGAAKRGGADIIDLKEPAMGPLGRASLELCREVDRQYAGTHPITAAGGELVDYLDGVDPLSDLIELNQCMALVKLGTSRLANRANWQNEVAALLSELPTPSQVVLVAYADAEKANSPTQERVAAATAEVGGRVAMVDTFDKQGAKLLELWSLDDLSRFVDLARRYSMAAATAGRVGLDEIAEIATAGADIIGVRGAACLSGKRDRKVDARLVAKLHRVVADWQASRS